jgi:hypothetical protein
MRVFAVLVTQLHPQFAFLSCHWQIREPLSRMFCNNREWSDAEYCASFLLWGDASLVGRERSADASGWINKRRRCERIALQTFTVLLRNDKGKQRCVSRQRANTCRSQFLLLSSTSSLICISSLIEHVSRLNFFILFCVENGKRITCDVTGHSTE